MKRRNATGEGHAEKYIAVANGCQIFQSDMERTGSCSVR